MSEGLQDSQNDSIYILIVGASGAGKDSLLKAFKDLLINGACKNIYIHATPIHHAATPPRHCEERSDEAIHNTDTDTLSIRHCEEQSDEAIYSINTPHTKDAKNTPQNTSNKNMDCHDLPCGKSRNDKQELSSQEIQQEYNKTTHITNTLYPRHCEDARSEDEAIHNTDTDALSTRHCETLQSSGVAIHNQNTQTNDTTSTPHAHCVPTSAFTYATPIHHAATPPRHCEERSDEAIYNTDTDTLTSYNDKQDTTAYMRPKPLHFINRYIDRMPDSNEANFYLDSESFEILGDFFISKWSANSHNYGIAKHSIQRGVNIISISRGAIKDFESISQKVAVIEVFVPPEVLKERLEKRGREDKEAIQKRLQNANKSIIAKRLYRFDNSNNIAESSKNFAKLCEQIIHELDSINLNNTLTSCHCEEQSDEAIHNTDTDALTSCHCETLQSSGVAIHNINTSQNTSNKNMDCHDLPCGKSRNDKQELSSQEIQQEYNKTTHITNTLSIRHCEERSDEAIHSTNTPHTKDAKNTSQSPSNKNMDCHDLPCHTSYNDKQDLSLQEQIDQELIKVHHTLEQQGIPPYILHYDFLDSNLCHSKRSEESKIIKSKITPKIHCNKAQNLSPQNHNNPSKILHFLGSSDSGALPVHNCQCKACSLYRQNNARNLATSAFLKTDSEHIILLDCGIEEISNLFDGSKIASIFLTHFHPDHALGLLRLRYSKDKITCYHPNDKQGFSDLFKHTKSIEYITLQPFVPISVENLTFTPIPLKHSKPTFGYFIESSSENIAYLTDCAGISSESLEFLQNKKIDICYLDAGALELENNKGKDSNNHLSMHEARLLLDLIKPKHKRLIHISHKILTSLL